MVNTVCAIRFRGAYHSMTRQVWRIVAVSIGLLMGLGYGIMLAVGAYAVGAYGQEVTAGYFLAYLGIVLFLFCTMVPMMFHHMLDPALDPRQYAPIVSPSRKLSFALLAAMGIGPFGLVWLFFAVVPLTVMWIAAGKPLLAICAFIAGFIQYFIGIVLVRLSTAIFGQAMSRSAEKGSWTAMFAVIVYLLFFVGLGIVTPVITQYFTFDQMLIGGKVLSAIGFSGSLVWPALIADSAWISLIVNIAVTIVVIVVAFEWWHRFATQAILQGKPRSIDVKQKQLIDAAARGETQHKATPVTLRTSAPMALPMIDRLTAIGFSDQSSAIIARIFVYTRKDVRITSQALMTPLFLLMAFVFTFVGSDSFIVWEFIVFAGVFGGFVLFNSISLDGKAVWLHVASPLSTRNDIVARLVAYSVIPFASILLLGPVFGFFLDNPHSTFVVPTLALSVFICSLAVSLFGMARWTSPQAKAGKLTMKGAGAGMSGAVIGRIFLTFALIALLMIAPGIALGFAYNSMGALTAFLTCVGVVLYSVLITYLSYRVACTKLQKNYPKLLTTIRTYP